MYSLLGSCVRNGHPTHDYLKEELTRLLTMTDQDDLRVLLSSQWKAASLGEAAVAL